MPGKHGYIETFESLVDLFTLLSFALIIASFLFGIQKVQTSETAKVAEISFKKVIKGEGSPVDLPENYLVLVLMKEKGQDMILLVESGEKVKKIYQSGQPESLGGILSKQLHDFQMFKFYLVILEAKGVNYRLFYEILKWFEENSIDPTVSFSEG